MGSGLAGLGPGAPLAAGFASPVFDSQRAFRAAMEGLASPCVARPLHVALPGAPLRPAAAALLLALCDYETTLHLSPALSMQAGIADYIRFHTDAVIVADPGAAAFAVVDLAEDRLSLAAYAQGNPEYPDRSTTIIALAASLEAGEPLAFSGPGIERTAELRIVGLPEDFADQWRANRARFPLGVDLLFATDTEVVGLPRSARLIGEAR
jgi:alpha-D-ribose 1-methylphosphonate 5-triphosphate synthase subunit PhnH